MRSQADWIKLKHELHAPVFKQIIDMGYEYSWRSDMVLTQLKRGHINWPLISSLEPLMHEIVTEYQRLVRTQSSAGDMPGVTLDIQNTLAPFYKDKMGREWRLQWFKEGANNPAVLEVFLNMYLVLFSNFVESRVYNKLVRLVNEKDAVVWKTFAVQSVNEAGITPTEKKEEEAEQPRPAVLPGGPPEAGGEALKRKRAPPF